MLDFSYVVLDSHIVVLCISLPSVGPLSPKEGEHFRDHQLKMSKLWPVNRIFALTSFLLSWSFREMVCNSVCLGWNGGMLLVCQQVKLGNALLEILQSSGHTVSLTGIGGLGTQTDVEPHSLVCLSLRRPMRRSINLFTIRVHYRYSW